MVIGRPVANSEAIGESAYPSSKQPVLYVGGDTSGRGRTDVDFAAFQMQKSVLRIPAIVRGMGVRRPMSMTLSEMERTILAEVGIPILQDKDRMETRREATVLREMWKEQFRLELEGVERIDAEFKKGSVSEQDESLRSQAGEIPERDAVPPLELQKLRTQPLGDRQQDVERDRKEGQQLDIYGHMEQQIAELQKSYEELMAAEAAKTTSGATKVVLEREGTAGGEEGPSKESHSFVGSISARSGEVEASYPKAGAVIGDSGELASLASGRLARSGVWASDTMPASDGADFSARAKSILGPYKDAPAFWAAKFNGHMATAEKYLEEGRFYRSADAYTLAVVYKPEEPLAYMGKSHALFAAGEYMSSALFLSRAVTAVGEGQKKKDYEVQQLLALGSRFLAYIDRDRIENRVVDIKQWQQRSGSAELQFLLGYLYYQMGRLDAAGEAIDAAFKQMPGAPAVIALREVIHSKKRPHEGKNP
jgi:tetratricopeptide (TPR) repeat protein